MAANFVSTFSLLNGPRLYAKNAQSEVTRLNKEMVEGRFADVGLVLGARAGSSAILYQDLARIEALITSNGAVSGRMQATQAALDDLRKTADGFMSSLIALPSTGTSPAVIRDDARRNLDALLDKLNSVYAGTNLFSGIKSEIQPMKDGRPSLYNDATPPATGAFPNFLTNLGKTAGELTAAEITDFLTAATTPPPPGAGFEEQFSDANWAANWSDASSTNISNQISLTEKVTTSVNANQDAFRELARIYNALGTLPADQLNENAFKAAVSYAIEGAGRALDDLTVMQANIGSTQKRITVVNESLSLQKDLLKRDISGAESVDPAEAKVKADILLTQINMSFSLTAQLVQLSLLNYVR